MTRCLLTIFAGLTAMAFGQTVFDNGITTAFPGVGAVHIHTESSLARSPLAAGGVVALTDEDVSHRVVMDRQGQVLFAYDLALAKVENDGQAYSVRAMPTDPDHLHQRHATLVPGDPRSYPTIAAPREFSPIHLGETIRLEVLANPATGERVFDVIRPVEAPAPRRVALEDEIVFDRIRISINDSPVQEWRNSTKIDPSQQLSLPGHGTIELMVRPPGDQTFEPVGRVDGKTLWFPLGTDTVRIEGRTNILKTAETGVIWVRSIRPE